MSLSMSLVSVACMRLKQKISPSFLHAAAINCRMIGSANDMRNTHIHISITNNTHKFEINFSIRLDVRFACNFRLLMPVRVERAEHMRNLYRLHFGQWHMHAACLRGNYTHHSLELFRTISDTQHQTTMRPESGIMTESTNDD